MGGTEKFYMKIFVILPKFYEKTLSSPGDIKTFRSGRMYIYTLLTFMDAVFSEETELMKWVGIFQLGNFWVGILRGDFFSGGDVDGWEFCRGKFPRIMVSNVCLRLGWEREGAASSKFATFWGIKIFLKIRVKKDSWIQKRNQTLVPTM